MSRMVRDSNLETRTARLRLKPRGKPYWRVLDKGLHLGYRRRSEGSGTWIARRFIGKGKYLETRLNLADDLESADALMILSFSQAQEKARAWHRMQERSGRGLAPDSGPYTVRKACDDYLKAYLTRGGKSEYATRKTIDVHIVPFLGDLEFSALTTALIRDWHHRIATSPARLRTGKYATKQNLALVDPSDLDAVWSRRATANRVLTVLKAALNHAFHERHVLTDESWRAVRPFKSVDAPTVRYLSADECRRLVNACEPDIRMMVQAALLTGCRYGELCRLRWEDVNLDAGLLSIRQSKGGKPRHVVLTDEAQTFVRSILVGKRRGELLFVRTDGKPWKAAQQTRPVADACRRATIDPPVAFHVLRHTHASTLAMKGVPMGVIAAQLGHADTRITERHYAHLAPNYVADTIRDAFPRLGILEGDSRVMLLRRS